MAKSKLPRSKRGPSPMERRIESAAAVARAQRADAVMSLKRQGWSHRAIGASLDPPLSHTMVQKIISGELALIPKDHADEVRKLELERLDELQTGHYSKAVDGDAFATSQVLAIMDRRAKLAGINAPDRSIVKNEVDASAAELDAKLEALSKKLAESDADDVARDAMARAET